MILKYGIWDTGQFTGSIEDTEHIQQLKGNDAPITFVCYSSPFPDTEQGGYQMKASFSRPTICQFKVMFPIYILRQLHL
jgi:hypothetical protein